MLATTKAGRQRRTDRPVRRRHASPTQAAPATITQAAPADPTTPVTRPTLDHHTIFVPRARHYRLSVSGLVLMVSTFTPSSVLRRLRQRVGPAIDRAAQTVGQPITRVYPAGYVGTVHRPIDEVESELRDGGFTWDPLSVYHYTLEGDAADGSWAYRSSWRADRQVHVVLFAEGSETTDVYAHDEFNWSRHPVKHAREVDIRRYEGRAEVRRWLDDRGLAYERDSVPLRRIRHAVTRLRERLDENASGCLPVHSDPDSGSAD